MKVARAMFRKALIFAGRLSAAKTREGSRNALIALLFLGFALAVPALAALRWAAK